MPDIYIRNDGQVLVKNKRSSYVMKNVHREDQCGSEHCVIHNPSDHLMRDFDLILRESTLMERVCPHGVGHPDPDSLAYFMRVHPDWCMDVHGCDGCCLTDEEWKRRWDAIPDDAEPGRVMVGTGRNSGITGYPDGL